MKANSGTWGILTLVLFFSGCNKAMQVRNPTSQPQDIFDNMWSALDKNYALFNVKNVDWDSVYAANHEKLKTVSSDDELFKGLNEVLQVLRDGHVTLLSDRDTATYDGFYVGYPVNFNLRNVETHYLNNSYSTKGTLIYKVYNGIGYLYVASFRDLLTDDDLDQIFDTLSAAKGLIVDVRNNTGGDIENVERLFSRFISEKHMVKYEVFKHGPGHLDFFDKKAYYASPASHPYAKPVMVLTNRTCFSACNDFVMYMSELPNITIVGDQTGGGGAIPADFILLNGWKLQYSASMTLTPDGVPIENGILPDYRININSIDDANGNDPILNKAIDLLQ